MISSGFSAVRRTHFDPRKIQRGCSLDEAKKAHRRLVKELHSGEAQNDPVAQEKLKRVNLAWERIRSRLDS